MLCNDCCRIAHKHLPLHRVECWAGTHFQPAWLWQNGYVLHLGHGGEACTGELGSFLDTESDYTDSDSGSDSGSDLGDDDTNIPDLEDQNEDDPATPSSSKRPHRGPPENSGFPHPGIPATPSGSTKFPVIVIVDVSGIHEMPVHFCTCPTRPISHDLQLLDVDLFPATFRRPKTAFTFRVLDDFRLDNLESKTSAYHYYSKLRRVTNPAFPASVKVCRRDLSSSRK